MISRLLDMLSRVASYPLWEVAIELLLIGLVVFMIVRFLRGTRAASAIKTLLVLGVLVTVLIRLAVERGMFDRLSYLYDRTVAVVFIALIVIFQPELRRALIRLGEAPLLRSRDSDLARTAREIATACVYLSKQKFGAIIAVERRLGLRGIVEGGTQLNAELSARLLQSIFFPGSALHDLAVVIRDGKIAAGGVQLPLADPEDMPDPSFGSRHRAAVGLTGESDALVIVVSEETGYIRIAEKGVLSAPLDRDDVEPELRARLGDALAGMGDAETQASLVADVEPPSETAGATKVEAESGSSVTGTAGPSSREGAA